MISAQDIVNGFYLNGIAGFIVVFALPLPQSFAVRCCGFREDYRMIFVEEESENVSVSETDNEEEKEEEEESVSVAAKTNSFQFMYVLPDMKMNEICKITFCFSFQLAACGCVYVVGLFVLCQLEKQKCGEELIPFVCSNRSDFHFLQSSR